ncbi:hypothetical protein [Bacillus wiedmannii]|uniref:Magnesium transporter CorA family protein n=1 Tax=Bacillus wiedmannii TaxID=1890302 RepID=A0ABX5DMC3_9BACI|nr:hypothetical protein [Bacillus wiedmannii]PRT35492.1 hypothetical protein C6357_28915 [Bacillus wiedmannii]
MSNTIALAVYLKTDNHLKVTTDKNNLEDLYKTLNDPSVEWIRFDDNTIVRKENIKHIKEANS